MARSPSSTGASDAHDGTTTCSQHLLSSPAWFAAGFAAHVGWDLLHHNRIKRIDTPAVPGWYAVACIAFDLPLALAALILR